MKVRNIQLKTIEARRYTDLKDRPKQVRIDHNSKITRFSEIKDNQSVIDFEYTSSYGPVGMIKFEGSMIFEDENVQQIADEWNGNHKMANEIAGRIHTAIMHASVPEAVGIAKTLALPPPIPLPQVKLGSKPDKGQAGPEVA